MGDPGRGVMVCVKHPEQAVAQASRPTGDAWQRPRGFPAVAVIWALWVPGLWLALFAEQQGATTRRRRRNG